MILALRALGLGDLLTAVPALRALRRHLAPAELALALPEPLHPLAHRMCVADEFVAVPSAVRTPPSAVHWSGPAPSLAVNLHGRGPQSTAALAALRPRQLWAFDLPGAPRWRADEHEVRRWCRLVAGYGCPADPTDLYLAGTAADRAGGPVVIHPGAAGAARRWPAQRFAAVARHLAGRSLPVRITAGAGEAELAAQVAARAGLSESEVFAGRAVTELTDLIAASRLVVCGDTGVAHLATACRTPSVLLFGPQSPARWGPPADEGIHQVLWHRGNGDDRADGQRPHRALLRIQPAEVLAAAEELLAATGRFTRPTFGARGNDRSGAEVMSWSDIDDPQRPSRRF
ncbi:MAG TPA: glycosyltransferase family 9 protein [Micromonosporaceae bacterium]